MKTMVNGKLYMPMTKNNTKLLQVNWHAPRNIKAYITTCHDDFNLALHVNDDKNKVLLNRAKLRQYTPNEPLWLNQTHSTTVINWDSTTEYKIFDADASISKQKQKVCIVMTADCLPILLTNKNGDFVAAIHAGWRGLDNGIIKETITKLYPYNTKDMIAFIGPAIGQECFEIGSEVYESFIQKNTTDSQYFTPSKNTGKFMGNLRKIAEQRLIELGLLSNNISNSNICTMCNTNWFFSYRDSSNTGRFATLVWIE